MELLVKGCLLMGRLVIGTYSNGQLDVWSYWMYLVIDCFVIWNVK